MAKPSTKKSSGRPATRRARKTSSPGGRVSSASSRSLAAIPVEVLAAELKRRRSEIPKLEARAKTLRAELAAVESRIALISGSAPAAVVQARAQSVRNAPKRAASSGVRAVRRMNGKPTLAERILAQLRGSAGPMSPRAIAEGLSKELGREVNQSFLVHISVTLRKLVNGGLVAQPARAQYVAKDVPGEPSH
jgi:hypothetical protein